MAISGKFITFESEFYWIGNNFHTICFLQILNNVGAAKKLKISTIFCSNVWGNKCWSIRRSLWQNRAITTTHNCMRLKWNWWKTIIQMRWFWQFIFWNAYQLRNLASSTGWNLTIGGQINTTRPNWCNSIEANFQGNSFLFGYHSGNWAIWTDG